MCRSGFSEDIQFKQRLEVKRSRGLKGWFPRPQIELRDDKCSIIDFDVAYAVLVYLYTNTLRLSSYKESGELETFDESQAMELNSLAHYWAIPTLQDDILLWFRLLCTPGNIISRVTDSFEATYQELYEVNVTYLRENWCAVVRFHKYNSSFYAEGVFSRLHMLVKQKQQSE